MRRTVVVVGAIALTALLPGRALAASPYGEHLADSRYRVSFDLPASWKHPTVTTGTTGVTKLVAVDTLARGVVGVIQVEVIAGRHVDAAEVAAGISSTGVRILGSKVVRLAIGDSEQISFEAITAGVTVYGTVEGFYRKKETYYVSFDSTSRSVANTARTTTFATWGH